MRKYEMKITPHTDASGQSYWVVNFPAIDACSGGGYTVEEAIKEAEENLSFYLEYLENEKIRLPEEYKENNYSGKIALRISKTTHKVLNDMAEEEGISVNSLINAAIENYIGKKSYENDIQKMIEGIQKTTIENLKLSAVTCQYSKNFYDSIWNKGHQLTYKD